MREWWQSFCVEQKNVLSWKVVKKTLDVAALLSLLHVSLSWFKCLHEAVCSAEDTFPILWAMICWYLLCFTAKWKKILIILIDVVAETLFLYLTGFNDCISTLFLIFILYVCFLNSEYWQKENSSFHAFEMRVGP